LKITFSALLGPMALNSLVQVSRDLEFDIWSNFSIKTRSKVNL